jgi:outer membrane murein-binding lipoprotein Lpp
MHPSRTFARDWDAERDPHMGMARQRPTRAPPRYAAFQNDRFASNRPSIGRRVLLMLTRFFLTILLGVGITLGWQSFGDEAKAMVRVYAPSLAWLVPVSTTQSPPEMAQQLQPMALDIGIVRRAVEQLATNQEQLAAKQDQLAARQEQIAQNIAALRQAQQEVSQQVSSAPPVRTVHIAPRKPAQAAAQ